MILVSIIGGDSYLGADYSAKLSTSIASLYEVDEDEVLFYVPDSFIYHKGVEQTSFNVVVKIECEAKYRVFQEKIATYILKAMKEFSVHVHVIFSYFEKENVYQKYDETYPKFLKQTVSVNCDTESEENEEDDEEQEVYTGNIFEDYDRKHKDDN